MASLGHCGHNGHVSTRYTPWGCLWCIYESPRCSGPASWFGLNGPRLSACPADEPEGYGAYYDLKADPWQVHNRARVLPHGERDALRKRLHELRACQGQAGCA